MPKTPKLFEDAPDREVDSPVVRLERLFVAEHTERWGCAPVRKSIARERKHLKDLLAQLDEAELGELIHLYFTTRDPQVTRRDYSLPVFFELAPRLRIVARNGAQSVNERTAGNIESAARATGRRTP